MPTHIFVDLGLWPDSIDGNLRAMDVAYQKIGSLDSDWLHASYFLVYSLLQVVLDE